MSKDTVSAWDTTPANNTDVGGVDLAENSMRPRDVNNAIRTMMAQIATGIDGGEFGPTDAEISEKLTANRTYYVRTDGSDSNTGLANTAGGAFLTAAAAAAAAYTIDHNGYTVTIKYGDDATRTAGATFTGRARGQTTAIIIEGNTGDPDGVIVSTTSANCFAATLGALVHVKDMELRTTTAGSCLIASTEGQITYSTIRFGACAAHHKEVSDHGRIYNSGNYSIVGSAVSHEHVTNEGYMLSISCTVTITGTPAFSSFFLGVSCATAQYVAVTYSGSATGKRHLIHDNGTVNTDGAYSATYFPGDVAGEIYGGGRMDDEGEVDYETGTFTPTSLGDSTAGAGTYTSQIGSYTKIGRTVNFNIVVAWTAHTGTGNLRIGGLPYTAATGPNIPCNILPENLTFSNTLGARVLNNNTHIQLLTSSTGAAAAVVAMDTAATIYVTGTYTV
jgi:hypothetical protein